MVSGVSLNGTLFLSGRDLQIETLKRELELLRAELERVKAEVRAVESEWPVAWT